jgi:AcrR family transcriptional regulator
MTAVHSRRDRLRAATIAEIKTVAHRYLVEEGPAAISRRAIARDMGMSAPALARYFPTLDTLITALTADAYDSLRTEIEKARDAIAEGDLIGRFTAAARAFRRWALAHPAEFQLAFGKPPPALEDRAAAQRRAGDPRDVTRLTHEACGDAGMRFGAVFTRIFADLWTERRFPTPEPADLDPGLLPQLDALAEEINAALAPRPGLPTPAVYVFLACWTRLYGLVAVEAFGHQRWALSDAEPLFETELMAIVRQLEPAREPAAS